MNYFDILLAKKLNGGGGGDVTVVPLSVTDNGIYSEEGKAYSPVTVEVAPPENSYQLKSITTPTSLATFEASAMPMPSLKVSVEAKQDLHGYDHPWVGGAGENIFKNITWEQGAISSTEGRNYNANKVPSDTRIRIATLFPVNNGKTYTIQFNAIDFEIVIQPYNADGTSQTAVTPYNQWLTNYQEFTATGNIAIAIRKKDGTDITPSDATNANVKINYGTYENICPISGWSEVNVSDVGKNLLDPLKVKTGFVYNPDVGTQFTLTDIADMVDNGDGTFSKTISGWYRFGYLFKLPESECFFKIQYSGAGARVSYGFLDDSYTVLSKKNNSDTNQTITESLAKTGTRKYFFITVTTNQITSDITFTEPQIEIGTSATTYEPYNGTTTTISLPQTVYGGEVDVVNGILKITDGYIASYNGETLPSTWISSMDVYAEGTSPTTGAEVCYELANPIITNLTPTLIKSLNGTNNLSVDSGDVIEGEYFKALGGE